MCSNDNISVLKFRNSKSYMFAILVSATCFHSVPLEKIIETQYSFLYYLKKWSISYHKKGAIWDRLCYSLFAFDIFGILGFIFLIHVGIKSLETQLYSQLPVGKKLPPFFRGEILCVYRHFSGGKDG